MLSIEKPIDVLPSTAEISINEYPLSATDLIYFRSAFHGRAPDRRGSGRITAAPLSMKPSRRSETRVGGYSDAAAKVNGEATTRFM